MPGPGRARQREVLLTGALLSGTALLYLSGLSRSGWGNSFYAAAAQAGARSWEAWFFGSSDAGNTITVDKPPAALWVMGLSVRLFGLSSWSLLVPEALMGVAAVALLVAAVRRAAGPGAGLLAGLLLAVTPVVTLMARVDDPDMLMTLLVVAAAWSTGRALDDDGRLRWTLAAGAFLGLAFLTKSLAALLVVPALALAPLVAGQGSMRRRVGHLLAGGAALAVAGGWWLLVVELVPAAHRPWVGGSSTNNPLDLVLGYNGLGRLTGDERGGGVSWVAGSGSPLRLLGSGGDQAGWLLPAAVVALGAGLLLRRGRPRTDPVRAALLLWGGWAVTTAGVFSVMRGIWHPYYTVELAPALAASTALGATLLWRRGTRRARTVLAAGSLVSTAWAVALVLLRLPPQGGAALAVTALAVAVCGLAAAAAVGRRAEPRSRTAALGTAALLLAAAVLGPGAWSVATAATPHTGSAVRAGPARPDRRSPAGPPVSAAALALLRSDPDDWTWTAAAVGHRAADLQLAARAPVMPLGGFFGRDPAPTLASFRADVAAHRVHWFVAGAHGAGQAARIDRWARAHGRPVRCGTMTLYDLSALSTVQPRDDDDPR
jgi:4-amino-4-deoxy-L-arabinose transferase-like glycosyltransferase